MRSCHIPKAPLVIILALASTLSAAATGRTCEGSLTDTSGFTVRFWKVETRWGASAALSSGFSAGQNFSPEKVSQAVDEVRQALLPQAQIDMGSKGAYSILYVDSCVETVGANQVDVTIRPYLVRIDLVKVGSNILPVPRFNHPAAPGSTPSPLEKLNPTIGLDNDRRAGVGESFGFSTDLLRVFTPADPTVTPPDQLLLDGNGRKALNADFYDANLRLEWSHERPASILRNFALTSSFESLHQPEGPGDFLRNAARVGALFVLSPHSGVFRKTALAGNYRWSSNRLFAPQLPEQVTPENGFEFRGVTDARLFGGMARFAGWLDGGAPSRMGGSYQRAVGLVGYAVDIPAAHHQTFGVEALFGAGHAWGAVPRYALFFGGNQGANFLYESVDSVNFASAPVGPLLRSYGKAQAGLEADGFWNFNLNVSVPIPPLSRPLIPAFDTPVGPVTELIKRQAVNSARSFLTAFYKKQGVSQKEAEAQAAGDVREIKPAVTYLADYANLYALKPLFLFDVANLGGVTRQATGGGLQLTIIVARFEAGYLRTINPLPRENRGNFVLRLTFENLF